MTRRTQMDLAQVVGVVEALLPDDWRAQAQYDIARDEVLVRITHPNRRTFFDVNGVCESRLYLSPDDFQAFVKPLVTAAVEAVNRLSDAEAA